ncbi:MAG TPA: hypothetical protein VGK56_07080 [Anaerolineales bacterium]
MANLSARIERAIEEMSGNEALLGMLETEAATEILNWGIATAKSVIERTRELDDFTAELALPPRLKAIRQSMRSIGNWAAGKYQDPESRLQLRDKLLAHFRTIFGERRELPTPRQMDDLLRQVDDKNQTPQQLILKLRDLLDQRG